MEADQILKNVLPGLIELALDPHHSLNVISVVKGEDSVKINLKNQEGKDYEISLEKS
jgi:hypothetical protein